MMSRVQPAYVLKMVHFHMLLVQTLLLLERLDRLTTFRLLLYQIVMRVPDVRVLVLKLLGLPERSLDLVLLVGRHVSTAHSS